MGKLSIFIAVLFLSVSICIAQINFDKPKEKGLLPNPYTATSPRDVVVEATIAMLKDMNIDLDTEKSKKEEGILVAKPVIFTRGTLTVSQLEHFSSCPAIESRNWSRGRHTLQMVIEPLDPSRSKISVSAKIEGERQTMTGSTWVVCESKGIWENLILESLVKRIDY
ncbi:MAG: hypothetical protein IPK14_27175 [Blastocatellia bacterium]|nr:hypothetical protein [Blastocatellia bacterium]MBL8196802.1 hypothetical protein [Blastocatellia bacterium]MBN8724371.1 hypothetical protein [Acidobacteriota bacterium]